MDERLLLEVRHKHGCDWIMIGPDKCGSGFILICGAGSEEAVFFVSVADLETLKRGIEKVIEEAKSSKESAQ